MKIKIITGFREDQQYSIDSEEAHKAYFIFLNPEVRTVFSNGLAILGSDIRRIEPDWHGIMGWNRGHKLDEYDWQEIKSSGKDTEINLLLEKAKWVADQMAGNVELVNMPLSSIEYIPDPLVEESRLLSEKLRIS